MQIANRLKEIQGDMSIREFARKLGFVHTTVHAYVQGGRVPTAEFIVRVCEQFDISPRWLLTGQGLKSCDKLARFEPIVAALDRNDCLAEVVEKLVDMDPLALKAIQGLIEYQTTMHIRWKAMDRMIHYLDSMLEKLGIENVQIDDDKSEKNSAFQSFPPSR
ncbi:helix-turn-helix domain-containing protein [Desulfoferrobacter suflitae]|uniref:helix-turn-helix domain-containing protein n=1 Tax=Desulfoferrobacter suflitae TaxID=2865782 RepID=UPI002164EB79|nr:helix-turn-helix transcriptional regulator [Desulfoferrobacter suflitae]MCK8600148.1 helix-turn-helix transcriptional regulator [Desulfoferrobacter suflitae]